MCVFLVLEVILVCEYFYINCLCLPELSEQNVLNVLKAEIFDPSRGGRLRQFLCQRLDFFFSPVEQSFS